MYPEIGELSLSSRLIILYVHRDSLGTYSEIVLETLLNRRLLS